MSNLKALNRPASDIPRDVKDMIARLASPDQITRIDRAWMCGYLTAMQQARDMLQELDIEVPKLGDVQ